MLTTASFADIVVFVVCRVILVEDATNTGRHWDSYPDSYRARRCILSLSTVSEQCADYLYAIREELLGLAYWSLVDDHERYLADTSSDEAFSSGSSR